MDDWRVFGLNAPTTSDEIARIYNGGNGTEDHIPVVRRLPIGTNGQILQADSSTPEGMKWVTAPAGGGETPARNRVIIISENLQFAKNKKV